MAVVLAALVFSFACINRFASTNCFHDRLAATNRFASTTAGDWKQDELGRMSRKVIELTGQLSDLNERTGAMEVNAQGVRADLTQLRESDLPQLHQSVHASLVISEKTMQEVRLTQGALLALMLWRAR